MQNGPFLGKRHGCEIVNYVSSYAINCMTVYVTARTLC